MSLPHRPSSAAEPAEARGPAVGDDTAFGAPGTSAAATEREVTRAVAAEPPATAGGAPRGGVARRRALSAESAPPGEQAHLELPALPARRLLAPGRPADIAPPFSMQVAELLASPSLDALLADDPETEERLVEDARRLAARAYPADRVTDRSTDAWVDHGARDELHRALLACYQPHVRLPHHGMAVNQFHPLAVRLLAALERPWERDLLARARRSAHRLGTELALDDLPADPDAFCDWYKTTAFTHPLYEHPLYGFLAGEADRAQMERFLRWEAAGEAAFDDLVALGQVGTRGEVKIEMGRNYWDELGNGKSHAVHTHLFHKLTETLAITAPEADELPWQILGGVNVMLWSCIPRRNAFRAQGTLGAVELLAPQRCTRLVTGALRLGIPKKAMAYYAAHAIIDVGHAEGWLDHVVKPQVAERPEARLGIAEGLLARADASLDYFDYSMAALRR
ncbi:MAG TPA: iron-containing redox enzyme family protein [Gemmatirosa sp.]|nr:iron-containing redox enzyme family protein [Gemmatirosa sp.]